MTTPALTARAIADLVGGRLDGPEDIVLRRVRSLERAEGDALALCSGPRWTDALAIHEEYYPLFKSFLKLDTNPVPIKAAMHLAGQCGPDLRLPMVALSEDKTAQLRRTLTELDLLPV